MIRHSITMKEGVLTLTFCNSAGVGVASYNLPQDSWVWSWIWTEEFQKYWVTHKDQITSEWNEFKLKELL